MCDTHVGLDYIDEDLDIHVPLIVRKSFSLKLLSMQLPDKNPKRKPKQEYESLLTSGMFWEFFPELSGDWAKDKKEFKKFCKKRDNVKK
jgi:hypothetical protein